VAALSRRVSRVSRPQPHKAGWRSRDRPAASDRRASPGHRDLSVAGIGGLEVEPPHPDPPPQGGRGKFLVPPQGGREKFQVRPALHRRGRANSRGGGGAEVVAAVAAPAPADRPTRVVHPIPGLTRGRAEIARGAEFAGIEWTGGALA
jgi:hypothetical protein